MLKSEKKLAMSGIKNDIKLSIITVNYNNANGLKQTLESVNPKSNIEYEIIIVDSRSTDGSLDIANLHSNYHKNFYIISEKDNGIYDGMNKGIINSKGHWVIFMNSGDAFYNFLEIDLLLSNENISVSYGNFISSQGTFKPYKTDYLKKGIIHACHQSMFFNYKILKENLFYNTKYKIYSDYDLVNRIFLQGFKFKYYDNIVARIELDGISQKVSWQKRLDKFLIVFRSYGFIGLINSYIYKK